MSRTLAKLAEDGADLELRLYEFWEDLSQGVRESEARGVKAFEYDAWRKAAKKAVYSIAPEGSEERLEWQDIETGFALDPYYDKCDQVGKVSKTLYYFRRQLTVIRQLSYEHPVHDEAALMNEYNININNSGIIAVDSILNHATNAVKAGPLPDARKEEFQALVEELKAALQSVPAEKAEDAALVAEQAVRVAEEVARESPRATAIKISAGGLLEAAKGIAGVAPIAMDVAKRIAAFVAGA